MKRTILVTLTALLFAAGCSGGGSGQPEPKAAKTETKRPAPKAVVNPDVTVRKALPSEIGQAAKCPVMGGEFKVKAKTVVAEYKGKAYYFCCPGCEDPFKADPEKHIKQG